MPSALRTNGGKFFVSCPCSSAALVTSVIPSARAACTIGTGFPATI